MLERMQTIEDRYDEINLLMSDPEVAVDYTRVEQLAREQAQLRQVVELSRQLRSIESEIASLRSLLRDEDDEEIVELAREEISDLEPRKEKTELDLKLALVPRGPQR